jgi:alkyl sulfatase BDS1-like metallo-beta-lactamase superfamily hydrolase
MVFQMAPGTEAPAEMHFHFPDKRALCMAENATHTLHNLLTLRGALVRDPHIWARYLTEAIELFADSSDVVFASHHWPTWGTENIVEYLSVQRDLYAFLHDQTLRLLNQGFTGAEIAEMIEMPPALEQAWHTHGYYGSVSHNVKAIYQRYLGWYDGNPARLWPHPPQQRATRYLSAMGGIDHVISTARQAVDEGDLRWPRRSWTMPSSLSLTIPKPAVCSPRCSSSSGTAVRTAPGVASTSPLRRSCGTATSAPPPLPRRPTSSPTSVPRCCSMPSPSR